jgi:L-fuconolactonase
MRDYAATCRDLRIESLERQFLQGGLARVLDAWGFDRCLWGTDWTRAFAVVNYEQAVEPFLKTSRLTDSERAMLMGGACAKAYGWSPKKGSAV